MFNVNIINVNVNNVNILFKHINVNINKKCSKEKIANSSKYLLTYYLITYLLLKKSQPAYQKINASSN